MTNTFIESAPLEYTKGNELHMVQCDCGNGLIVREESDYYIRVYPCPSCGRVRNTDKIDLNNMISEPW